MVANEDASDVARRAARPARLPAALLAVGGLVVGLVTFWPGQMSVDSMAQYIQAATGRFDDHHPPVMAWLWSWSNRVVPGPGGILAFHLLLLWGGLWAIAEGARREGIGHAWVILLVGALPFVANLTGIIWKDVGMAYALLCAVGLIYAATDARGPARIAALMAAAALIAFAVMVRANGLFAAFPVACYFLRVVAPHWKIGRIVVAGIVMVAALVAAEQQFARRVIHAAPRYVSQAVMLFDLAGIMCRGGEGEIPPAFRAERYDASSLCGSYDPDHVDTLLYLPTSPLTMVHDSEAVGDLRGEWLVAVLRNPRVYVLHRAHAFAGLLGLHPVPEHYRLLQQPFMPPNPWGFHYAPNALASALARVVDALADSGLFTGAVWIVAAALLIPLSAAWRGTRGPEIVLLVSGLAAALPYFLIAIAPNYRYVYWTVVATAVAAVLTLLRAMSPPSVRTPPLLPSKP